MKNIKASLASKTLISSAVVLSSALFSSATYAACTADVNLGAKSIINILNLTQTGAGTFTSGTGAVSLRGDTTIANGKNLTMEGASTFTSGTGAVSLRGDVAITGAKTFTSGTGAVNLNGDVAITGAKTFTSGTGAVNLNGDVAIASDKNLTMNGAGTFTSGTGNVTLSGNTTVAGDKTFTSGTGNVTLSGNTTVAGDKTFTSGTGNVTLSGNTTVAGAKTLTVGTGATSLGGTLGVTGTTTLNNGTPQSYTLPITRGTSAQVLTTNGAGVAAWSNDNVVGGEATTPIAAGTSFVTDKFYIFTSSTTNTISGIQLYATNREEARKLVPVVISTFMTYIKSISNDNYYDHLNGHGLGRISMSADLISQLAHPIKLEETDVDYYKTETAVGVSDYFRLIVAANPSINTFWWVAIKVAYNTSAYNHSLFMPYSDDNTSFGEYQLGIKTFPTKFPIIQSTSFAGATKDESWVFPFYLKMRSNF